MCMACEQQTAEMLWDMVETISHGEMPAGHTADDLRKLGLPQPGELIRDMQPDGTVIIRQIAPSQIKANAFACDMPQGQHE
jgi:hypothetical protein